MIESDDDRLAFFHPDDFGEEEGTVTVTPSSGQAADIWAIYDARIVDTRPVTPDNRLAFREGARPSGSSPSIRCRASDFPKAWAGTTSVVVRGVQYVAFDVKHDGTGFAIIELKKS